MESGRSLLEGRKIRIRMDDAELTIACADDGELAVSGGPSDSHLVALVYDYMYENLLSRGSTLSDVLRVAKRIAQAFNGEVLDLENVLEFVRRGWIRLLVANLMADPSQSIGERMNEFRAHRGLSVTVEATPNHVVHCRHAMVDIGDPQFLIVWRTDKPRWRARWERITRISFSYLEPPSQWLQDDKMKTAVVQRKRGKVTKPAGGRSRK